MEEWHQKLHNNTSPDDVVICQVCPSCYQYSLTGNILSYYSLKSAMSLLHICGRICLFSKMYIAANIGINIVSINIHRRF